MNEEIPPIKELRVILKWIIDESKLKELIEKEGGIASKPILENIWKNETAEKNLELMSRIEEPVEPSVPQPDQTILLRDAKEKFDEVMSLGEYLTPDMRTVLFSALKQDQNAVAKESPSLVTVLEV